MALGRNDWIREYYEEGEDKLIITCNKCSRQRITFKLHHTGINNFINHLRTNHDIIELDRHPDRDDINKKFNIDRLSLIGECLDCKKVVDFVDGVNNLKNHLIMYHGSKKHIFTILENFPEAEQVIKKCDIIMDSTVKCSRCPYNINLEEDTISKLKALTLHWYKHLDFLLRYFLLPNA